jgi:rod shape-determining protein MreC
MKRDRLFLPLIPLLMALLLLSLPLEVNRSLKNRFGSFFSKFWTLTPQKEKTAPPAAFEEWAKTRREEEKTLRKNTAKVLVDLSFSKALIGHVIYRSAYTWNSCLWIDVGEEDNIQGEPLCLKGSPVLSGTSLIGVVDYVGKKTSLVRLISDSGLSCAVRVARGEGDPLLARKVEEVKSYIEEKGGFEKEEEQKAFLFLLEKLSEKIACEKTETLFLAKGELQGHGEPLWRSPGKFLKGIGFNYDFSDSYGGARDLRTGAPLDPKDGPPIPLIQVGDILVTSGLDGVFPEGLQVARVHSVMPLREGAYFYEILATPTAEELLDVKTVIILPPQPQKETPDEVERLLKQ